MPTAAAISTLAGLGLVVLATRLRLLRQWHTRTSAYLENIGPSVGRVLNQVVANTESSILLCDQSGRVLWVNNGFTRLTGYTFAEVQGCNAADVLIGPETDLCILDDLGRCLDRCEPYRGEILNYRKDGGSYMVAFEALPICDAQGRPKSIVAMGRDVTDRLHAEQALREEESRYRAIFEAVTDALVIYNQDGTVIEANPAACAMYGYTRAQILGLSYAEIVQQECHPIFDEFQKTVTAGNSFHAVSRDVRSDGAVIDVEVHGVRLTFKGELTLLAVLTDITEQQRAQRELREYAEALQVANHSLEEYSFAAQEASRAKSAFLANMSHEIRTPMTAILGFAEMLRTDGDLSKAPPSRIEAIDTVLRNGEHLLRLINDVLDLSKIEAGRFSVEHNECCVLKLVSDVQDMVEIRARAKNLPFVVEYAGSVPETVQTDAMRLRQILVNLIGNAVKFTDTGEVRLRVEHIETAGSSVLEFAVIDTGVGISTSKLDTVFQPFNQAEEHGGHRGGTGLGLTISRELARLLGGDIAVESTLGQGSTFRLRVPTGAMDGVRHISNPAQVAASHRLNPSVEEVDSSQIRFSGRILLAEDGPDNQRLIECILRRAGAEVLVVDNGQAAIQEVEAGFFEDNPFDLVLMDMQMPVMDGYEATRRLRRGGYTLPIVALTAHAMKGDRLKCLDAGCDDYASKPIQRPQLLRLVSHYLASVAGSTAPPA